MRKRLFCWMLVAGVAGLGLRLGERPAEAQLPSWYVNTTEDLPIVQEQCLPQQICTLRAAIEKAQARGASGGGIVRVCYNPADTPKGKPCRGAAQPLKTSDPGYDPASGKWVFEFAKDMPYAFSEPGTQLDFTLDIDGWAGPQDNKIVIQPGPVQMNHAFILEGSGTVLKGIEIRGDLQGAAITVRDAFTGNPVSHNQLGPGLILAGIRPGVGIKLSGAAVADNRVVGNWCGITGDGTKIARNQEDCVQITEGSGNNTVGGPDPADRNIFAASQIGVGVAVEDGSTVGNTIQGNWFGLDAKGSPIGNTAGVTIKTGALETRILDNVISGNELSGITIFNNSQRTEIRGNTIGESPDRATCIGNGNYGIELSGSASNSVIEHNRIACNGKGGVLVTGQGTRGNRISQNSIANNKTHEAIRVGQGANGGIRTPQINGSMNTRVTGQACPGCTVEVFSDPDEEADVFEGSVQADRSSGLFIFDKPEGFANFFVKVTGTDPNNNTSSLSVKHAVGTGRTPTATTRPATGTPTPTTPGTPGTVEATPTQGPTIRDIYVPVTQKNHQR